MPHPAAAHTLAFACMHACIMHAIHADACVKSEVTGTGTGINYCMALTGFVKGDYEPREGRQGRFIADDPSKYPDKDDIGLFKGISGGWAGGEAALYKFREQIKVGGGMKAGWGRSLARGQRPISSQPSGGLTLSSL